MLATSVLVAASLMWPQAHKANLDVWFLKDKNQQSCASCHSVDGIELRSFSDADIRRRTARHHPEAVSAQVRALLALHAQPSGEPGTELRPMQPSGVVLSGKNPAERDNAFLSNLRTKLPKLFGPIRSLSDALAFQKTILNIDLSHLQIGIEMNRLSEDGAHGDTHRSIANWFPDVPSFDSSELRTELEAYLSKPSVKTLEAVDKKLLIIAKIRDAFTQLSLAKYRSLMVYQHELRTGVPTSFLPKENPFWQVAEFARVYAESDPIAVRVPDEIVAAKNMTATYKDQLKQMRLPWFWLGWMRDPSLTKSGPSKETARADYFCKFLEDDGPYIGHESFMLARKLAEQTRNPIIPNYPFEIKYSFFLANTPLVQREPKDPQAKQLFRQLTSNSFKMSLYLLEADILNTGKTIRKVPQADQIKYLTNYLKDIKQPSQDLVDRVLKRLNSAKGT